MKDQKILVTGPTGQVAGPVAHHLAQDNEVWATSRFSDESKKEAFEAAGITCVKSDLGNGDFSELPEDFDYVLHFACSRTPDFETDLTANGEGVGRLMSHEFNKNVRRRKKNAHNTLPEEGIRRKGSHGAAAQMRDRG